MNPSPSLTDTQKVFQPQDELQARFDAAFAGLERAVKNGNLAEQNAAQAEIKAIELEQSLAVKNVRRRIAERTRWENVRVKVTGTPNQAAVDVILNSIENFILGERMSGRETEGRK